MATISKADADAQRKQLQDDPSIQFGNLDARGVATGNKKTPGGVNLSATIYPSTTDQQGKTVQGAAGIIDKINQGLQQQAYGDNAPADNSWWDNLQDAIGSMGVGAKHGGGTYVPYSGQQLAYEQKQDTENQAYGQQYMDYLTGKNTNADAANKSKLYESAVVDAQKDPNWGAYSPNDQQAAIESIYNGMLAAYNSGSGGGAPSGGASGAGSGAPAPAGAALSGGATPPSQMETTINSLCDAKGATLNSVLATIAAQGKASGATPDQVNTWQAHATAYWSSKHPSPNPAQADVTPGANAPTVPTSIDQDWQNSSLKKSLGNFWNYINTPQK
jgi:hypothetical protein